MADSSGTVRAPLRPRGEVRRLLLEAARRLFSERGYARTSTRAIAREAGVAESLLHGHFGSKAQLFEEAVFDFFERNIIDVIDALETQTESGRTLEETARLVVEGVYDAFTEHRSVALALIAADAYDADHTSFSLGGDGNSINRLVTRLEHTLATEFQKNGLAPLPDLRATVSITIGMVLSTTVLANFTLPDGSDPIGRRRLVDEMTAIIVNGVFYRAARSEDRRPEG